jgi:hypothetical protein
VYQPFKDSAAVFCDFNFFFSHRVLLSVTL